MVLTFTNRIFIQGVFYLTAGYNFRKEFKQGDGLDP